ncbi:MAG: hypothetical protein AAGJ87_01455 [Pseudomonadota bacterium]
MLGFAIAVASFGVAVTSTTGSASEVSRSIIDPNRPQVSRSVMEALAAQWRPPEVAQTIDEQGAAAELNRLRREVLIAERLRRLKDETSRPPEFAWLHDPMVIRPDPCLDAEMEIWVDDSAFAMPAQGLNRAFRDWLRAERDACGASDRSIVGAGLSAPREK